MTQKKHQLEYKYPPDIQKCNNHRLATRIFKGLDQGAFAAECQCCERRIGTKQQTGQCCYDNTKLAFIGPGIPLLFNFLRNCILLLLILSITFVAYSIKTNLQGTDCTVRGSCSDNVFDILSIVNKVTSTDFLTIQNYVLLVFVVIFVFLMHYFRYSFRRLEDQCDDMVTSPSDYALILRRLPEGTVQADIEKMVDEKRKFLTAQQRQKTQNLRIMNIIMSFSMTQFKKVKEQNKQQFTKLLQQGKHEQFKPKPLPDLQKTANIAVIVFSRQQSKQLFRYKPNIIQKLLQCLWTPCIPLSDFRVKGENISVERAPEPDDIVWENSKISLKGAIVRKTLYSLFSILLLGVGGAIQFGLAVAQTKVSQDTNTQLIMSSVSSISISIINAVIQVFLVFTSQKQRNETLTQYNTVLMVKISFFQFLNTGVFVVAANFLADPQNFTLTKGFIFQITQVMILNAIIPNVTLLILTYCQVVQKIKRCLVERGTIKVSQMQANLIFQGPVVELPYKYAYVFKTIWLTAFYAPLSPVVVPISILGLGLNYVIQKLLFGRVYSSPCRVSSMVNDSAIELMEYFALIISLGEFVIYLYFLQFKPEVLPLNWSIPIYAAIAISILNLLLPMDSLNNKLFKMPSDTMVFPSYEKVEDKFQVTYEMTNPGYVCKRKRRRDLMVLGALFGNVGQSAQPGPGGQAIEMTGLGLLTGLGVNPAPPPGADLKNPIVNQQDPLYQNQNNAGPTNSNSLGANPLAAIFSPSKSPTNVNARNLNLPMSSPKQDPLNMPQSPQMNVPGLTSIIENPNNMSMGFSDETNERKQLIPNVPLNNKPPTFNGNNSLASSLTGAFPSLNTTTPMNNQPNFGFGKPNNLLTGSLAMVPPAPQQGPNFFGAQQTPFNNLPPGPPGFNQIPNSGYYNPTTNQNMGNNMPMQNWGGSINLAPESEHSYSSTRQVRKALEMRNMPPPTQF